MVLIHCVNQTRISIYILIKDAVQGIPKCKECDSFYWTIYYLFKNYGKLKTETACKALGITHYPLPKIHRTRFVNHRTKGFTKLLHLWPALITTFRNSNAREQGCKPETRAKIQGLLKKLQSYKFLCQTAVYLDLLESMGLLSIVFESNLLMAFSIQPAVEETLITCRNCPMRKMVPYQVFFENGPSKKRMI